MQKMAAAPGAASKDEEAPYGVGAFLAAGVEMKIRLVAREQKQARRISVSDASGKFVAHKSVTVELSDGERPTKVFDMRNGAFVPHAVEGNKLTFATYLPAGATREFLIGR